MCMDVIKMVCVRVYREAESMCIDIKVYRVCACVCVCGGGGGSV